MTDFLSKIIYFEHEYPALYFKN